MELDLSVLLATCDSSSKNCLSSNPQKRELLKSVTETAWLSPQLRLLGGYSRRAEAELARSIHKDKLDIFRLFLSLRKDWRVSVIGVHDVKSPEKQEWCSGTGGAVCLFL